MKRAIIFVVAAVVLVGLAAATRSLRQRVSETAADLKLINGDTGDVMASATYQRFARRREAVASMQAALLQVGAIESTFVADSGRPTVSLFGRYVSKDRYLLGPSVTIQRDRWVATVSHQNATMSCSLTALVDPTTFDSITWRYQVGKPVCVGWSAESTALANAPVPINPTPAPVPAPGPASPAEPLRAPRHHRDWGPVNNRPPAMPYIVKNACEGEGCARTGTWAACSTVVVRSDKRSDAPLAFIIAPQEKFTAVTADVHVVVPGLIVFRDTISNPGDEGGEPVDSIRFIPADTLYILNYLGEGYLVWWYRGQAVTGYQFWNDEHASGPYSKDVVAIRSAHSVWWVRVRNAAGKEGWIVGSLDRFATGGYMDEIERCLHPAKR